MDRSLAEKRRDPGAIRELGFSSNKTCAFLELAGNIVSGRINFDSLEEMDNEAAVASLLELRGVGRWTAEYVLLRGLKPLNVFPGDDVGAGTGSPNGCIAKGPLDYDGVARATRELGTLFGDGIFPHASGRSL